MGLIPQRREAGRVGCAITLPVCLEAVFRLWHRDPKQGMEVSCDLKSHGLEFGGS